MMSAVESPAAIPEVVRLLSNIGFVTVLGQDSRGQIVTQPTQQGLDFADLLEAQGCYEAISKRIRGLS